MGLKRTIERWIEIVCEVTNDVKKDPGFDIPGKQVRGWT